MSSTSVNGLPPLLKKPGNGRLKFLPRPETRLTGIIPPMITPLLDQDTLDVAGLERLVEHLVQGGISAIFILGTSGEAPSLSYRLRRELITRTCHLVKGRLPILVGITDTAFTESIALAQFAADAGANYAVTSTPYYFPASQTELLEYLERLVAGLPLPLFLYNMPMMTKIQFEPETLRRVSHLKKIVGLKDSSGDMEYFASVLKLSRQRPDWSFLIGPEHLLAESVQCGGQGGVNGGAQIWPALFVELYDAAARSDLAGMAELQKLLLQFGKIYEVGKQASSVIRGLKCALSLMGICSDVMAEPFSPFRAPERERVRAVLDSLGLPVVNGRKSHRILVGRNGSNRRHIRR